MALHRALAPLRHRGFQLLAGGQLTSNIGDAFYAVALPWYVLATHGGALLLGTVLAAYGVPRTALVAVSGHASDRWKPWTMMMAADAVRALSVGALAVVALRGPASAAWLVPIGVVLGAGEGLFLPASFSIVPSLLPDDDLQAGNALTSGGAQLAMLVGPAVGGAVVSLVGPATAFGVDAVSFMVSAATLLGVRARQRRGGSAPSGAKAPGIAEGLLAVEVAAGDGGADGRADGRVGEPGSNLPLTLLRFVASERVLQLALAVTVAANLGSGGMGDVALPSLVHGPFHSGARGYGALIAAFGGGALLGTLVAAQSRRARRPLIVASWVFLTEAVLMAFVPYLGGAIPAGGALAGFGALNGFGNVITITAFQRWAPRALLGRLMGLLMLASLGMFPVSVVVAGVVVRALGPALFFPIASVPLGLAVLAALSQPTWRRFGAPNDAPDVRTVSNAVTSLDQEPPRAGCSHEADPCGGNAPGRV